MHYPQIVSLIADLLKEYDSTGPIHKSFRAGIGPFGEPQIVKEISRLLVSKGIQAQTKRTPDLALGNEWAIEFKIIRPYGDNGREAENWTVNLLHPYAGNVSLVGDTLKLLQLSNYQRYGVFVIAYEHADPRVDLEPLIASFEWIAQNIANARLSSRIDERRINLIHPEHQVLRCIGWEVLPS